ncbi:MAG: M23 family metallopeptidase [Dehalococcoidia bacterium]|nr:M23 family metallopeptidase [Dehalococcoidia bacterium]MCB9484814.1 M23 family metallopeptidase [Thermoflexaceae bacterium]
MRTERSREQRFHRQTGRRRVAGHLFIVALAAGVLTYVAQTPANSTSAQQPAVAPVFSVTGIPMADAKQAGAKYFAPGTSVQTRNSIAALTTVADSTSLRSTAAVSPISSFSSGVALAAAALGESGAGVKPLADILDPRVPFVLYEAQPGDTVGAISERYGISLRTLLENNPTVEDRNLLQLGQQLIVPRKDGILYKVGHGETLDSIVNQYDNITLGTVLEYKPNNIVNPDELKPGEFVLLPGATVKPPPPPPPPPPEPVVPASPAQGGGSPGTGAAPLPGGAGLFSMPLAGYRGVSDRFGVDRGGGTYHTGIDLDLAGYPASNVFSACAGVVIRTEYLTYSYGYHVVVDCGGGWTTWYAHLSQILVTPGQTVSAGTIVGVSGVTGFTTGEHLHFEIRKDGAPVNPADYLPF